MTPNAAGPVKTTEKVMEAAAAEGKAMDHSRKIKARRKAEAARRRLAAMAATATKMLATLSTPRHAVAVAFVAISLCHLTSAQRYNGANSVAGPDLWQTERPADMAKIVDLEVMCGKEHMEVQVSFDRPFNGIIFSKGAVDRYDCIYVKPQTGRSNYKFDIMYNSCGSKPDLNGRFYENNIVVQYDQDLIEVWDEAKRLRCEWYNDYEKGVTKPPIRVSDIDVVELNFRGDNVDCWMEIQQGKGPWASPVVGIVPLGTTLTMVVGIDDKQGEFDMRVKSCEASDGRNRPISLSDENGCVLRKKMFSKFMKMRSTDARATVVTYAFFHAFKFPDTMAVQIRCKVEICRFGCPDHCQNPSNYVAREREVTVTNSLNGGGFPGRFQSTAGSVAHPNIGYSSNAALRKPGPPPPPGIPLPTIAKPSQGIYRPNIRREDQTGPKRPKAYKTIPVKLSKIRQLQKLRNQQQQQKQNQLRLPPGVTPSSRPQVAPKGRKPPPPPPPPPQPGPPPHPRTPDQKRRKTIHAPAPPPGIFENQRSSGGPQALPLIQERNDDDDDDDAEGEEMMVDEEEAGEARSAGILRRPPPPRNGPPPPPRSGGGGIANFLGLRLPELPSISLPSILNPFAGVGRPFGPQPKTRPDLAAVAVKRTPAELAALKERVKSEAIPISLGRTPDRDAIKPDDEDYESEEEDFPSAVPVSRSSSGAQPLVFPSSFNTPNAAAVVPIESLNNAKNSAFPYGPRALNVQQLEQLKRRKRSISHHRSERSAELGVESGYEVVSEADLAFSPDDEDLNVAVLKGRMQNSGEIVYGVCLPATGFSALFVVISLVTVVSILVSGFVCYQRQLQKVAEESAPKQTPAQQVMTLSPVAAVAAPVPEEQMAWGFNTWFRKNHARTPVGY